MSWWGKKLGKNKEEPKIEFYNPQVNGDWEMKGGNTKEKMAKEEIDEDEEFEEVEESEDEDEDLEEEEVDIPKKKAGRPQGSVKKKEVEEDKISVVNQLPTQQLRRALVDGKATSFETIEEALSNMRNDIADIKKAVGA